MSGGQGTGEIILLNLTDLVLLLIECMPAASGVRRKAAAAAVGVATGSAAATALANAARTDKTIEDMRAGEVAGTHGVPNPSKANANYATTPGECGEWPCTQDKVCELMFDKMLAYMHATTTTMQEQKVKMQEQQVKLNAMQQQLGLCLTLTSVTAEDTRKALILQEVECMKSMKSARAATVPKTGASISKFLQWASTHIEPCAASHIQLAQLQSALKKQKVFGEKYIPSMPFVAELVKCGFLDTHECNWNKPDRYMRNWTLAGYKLI